jgi:Holliday junction resolvasome RuvABC ATP-dependent DNA helicase subunit
VILIEISAKIVDFTVEMRKLVGFSAPSIILKIVLNSRFLKYSVRLEIYEAQEIKYEVISQTYTFELDIRAISLISFISSQV